MGRRSSWSSTSRLGPRTRTTALGARPAQALGMVVSRPPPLHRLLCIMLPRQSYMCRRHRLLLRRRWYMRHHLYTSGRLHYLLG